ncbi:hypothetical protein HJFPF1_03476 [Paramyrothecium foliicola]|nr:hypothetical protein HJFPF1_03476 [Paramyrothecium foliicola]
MAALTAERLAPERSAPQAIPESKINSARPRSRLQVDTVLPVNQDGCFEADRVIKSGYVQKRTQKTKTWKPIFIVLRPKTLSIYKNNKETKLRHQIYLSDLTAVAFLKDPKNKRQNVFGLFSPARNFHLQAPTQEDAEAWVELIRKEARIEEEEEEMFLASPLMRRQPSGGAPFGPAGEVPGDHARFLSSSPENYALSSSNRPFVNAGGRRKSSYMESSGNELASHSDFSDHDVQRLHGLSIESLAVTTPHEIGANGLSTSRELSPATAGVVEQDPDRVVWQGWLWFLRSKGGVKQWKHLWGVLRPRNLILYKDESEYTAQWIMPMPSVVNVVDIDPLSKSKVNCLQVITEEKSYRFCAHDEEALVHCIGAFKSLLSKRREMEARAAASSSS